MKSKEAKKRKAKRVLIAPNELWVGPGGQEAVAHLSGHYTLNLKSSTLQKPFEPLEEAGGLFRA